MSKKVGKREVVAAEGIHPKLRVYTFWRLVLREFLSADFRVRVSRSLYCSLLQRSASSIWNSPPSSIHPRAGDNALSLIDCYGDQGIGLDVRSPIGAPNIEGAGLNREYSLSGVGTVTADMHKYQYGFGRLGVSQ